MRNFRSLMAVAVTAALACTTMARAASDADRVPADALAYAHWAGSDALGAAYAGSHFKGFIDALNVQQYVMQRLQQAEAKKAMDPQQKADADLAKEVLRQMGKSPTSLYVGPVDFSNPDRPMPNVAIFSKLGKAEAANLVADMNAAIARAKKEDSPPTGVVVAGDYLLVTIGSDADISKRLTDAAAANGLGASEGFKAAMGQVGDAADDAAASVYINGDAVIKTIDDAVAAKGPEQGRQMWPKIEDALGITELKQMAWAGRFDGADWAAQGFVGMGEKRTGLLAFLDNKPASAEVYKLIPQDAVWCGLARFDGMRLLDDIRTAVAQTGPRGPQQFDFALQQFFAFTGVDLKNDLFASFGDEFVAYGTQDATGNSMSGAVFLTRLKDAAKADKALSALETTIGATIAQRTPNSHVQFTTEALVAPHEKVTAHLISTPTATPAWAISDGVLFVSMSKAGLQTAVDGFEKTTIAENPQFAALQKKLGHEQVSSFSFEDLVKTAPETYGVVSKLLAEAQAKHLEGGAPYVLPPLEKLTPNLGPAMDVAWTDGAGLHIKSVGPIPLARALSPKQLLMQSQMMKAREKKASAGDGAMP